MLLKCSVYLKYNIIFLRSYYIFFFFNRVILLYNRIYELHKHSTNSYAQTSYRSIKHKHNAQVDLKNVFLAIIFRLKTFLLLMARTTSKITYVFLYIHDNLKHFMLVNIIMVENR